MPSKENPSATAIYTRPDLCALLRPSDEKDVAYYRTATESCAEVLDLGCGFGRVSLAIAPGKRRVIGLDPSHDMLAEFRKRLAQAPEAVRDHIELVVGSMEQFELPHRFDAAIIPFSSFQYMLTPKSQKACLASCRAHLREGGLFAMDMMDAEAVRNTPPRIEARGSVGLDSGATLEYHLEILRDIDEAAQIVTESIAIDIAEPAPITGGRFQNTYRYFIVDEIRRLAADIGFTVENLYSDYQRTPYAPGNIQVWELRNTVSRSA
jgi:SAM-dependent methyltransferase